MDKPIHVACMRISCGMMNEVDCYLRLDGTLEVAYSFLSFYLKGSDVLVQWTPRDLLIASEYVEHREDYYKAERGFRFVLYSRGCMTPRYPVPALRETVKFHQHGMISIQHAQGGWIRAWWRDGHWGYETSGKVHYVD